MKRSRSYRDLIVWQKSMNLVNKIYNITHSFPKEEIYGITSQMRRAGIPIPANIAEGQARNSKGEFHQFLGIAQGSLAELETLILICQNLEFIQSMNAEELLNNCEEIAKLLAALKKSLTNQTFHSLKT